MQKKLLMISAPLLAVMLQGCSKFGHLGGADSSPITISDDRIHYHHTHGFSFDPKKPYQITADESKYTATKIIVHNCPALPCSVDLNGNSWSAQVLDQDGNVIDQITASSTVTVQDTKMDKGFVQDTNDNTSGPGYYHDPPDSGGGPILIGSLSVTVGGGSPTQLQCPPNNCKVIVQYCYLGAPDPANEYKCK